MGLARRNTVGETPVAETRWGAKARPTPPKQPAKVGRRKGFKKKLPAPTAQFHWHNYQFCGLARPDNICGEQSGTGGLMTSRRIGISVSLLAMCILSLGSALA